MGSYKKKLFIVLLLILLLNFFVCSSVNAAEVLTDIYNYNIDYVGIMKQEQELLANMFFNGINNSNITENQLTTLKNLFKNNYYFFKAYSSNTVDGWRNVTINFYPKNINFNAYSLSPSLEYETDEYYLYDPNYLHNVSGYVINCTRFRIELSNYTYSSLSDTNVSIPSFLIGYQNNNVDNFLNGVPISSSPWVMIYNAIHENTEQQEETTDEMKKLNNFMSSEDVDQDAYDMPTNNPTQDPTTDGINNIFNKFYSRITNWDSSNISVYIPFANKSFTIPANASEQLLAKFSNMGLGSTLKSLISAVWFYVLARYIIKDVQKYVDGLKTGEILTKSDTNIKTEML